MKHDGPNDLLTDETGALKPDLVETLDKIDSKLKELSEPPSVLAKIDRAYSALEQSSVLDRIVDIPPMLTVMPDTTIMGPSPAIQAALESATPAFTAIQDCITPIVGTNTAFDAIADNYQWKSQLTACITPAMDALNGIIAQRAELVSSTISSVLDNYTAYLHQAIETPVMTWLQNAVQSPIIDVLQRIQAIVPSAFNPHQFNELYLREMHDAKWFPYLGWNADITLAMTVLDIIDNTRKSKNRVKQIDKAVFSYYTKSEIEAIRKSWRELNLPPARLKILNQAVKAYHRKEYALTVSPLVSLWEGIIAEKANIPDDYRISSKTRQTLTKLIEENEFDRIFSSFCEDFIFYDCRKPEDVKQDVPGRHGIAHSWYDKYPSRKMALNAILFTDFLLKLEPSEQMLRQSA